METEPQLLCLRWNNHQSNLVSVFDQLLQNEAFCDVTLAVEGKSLKCHQMVLAAASPYFQAIFMENTCRHPIVFLKDIKYTQIRSLLEYVYYGEASVQEEELQGLLKIAEALKIKGLVEIEEETISKPTRDSSRDSRRESNSSKSSYTPSSGSKPNIWPTSPAKLLGSGRVEKEDDGVLVIDEENSMDSNSLSNMSAVEMNAENYHGHYMNDESPPAPGMIRVVGANGKAEWKRYKQYTKDDIVAAIEEVKNGMSALQASRKYGVPSRTLYDKVKKMGILTANMQKQIQQQKKVPTSQVPMINSLGMQLPQVGLPKEGIVQKLPLLLTQKPDVERAPSMPGSLLDMMTVMMMNQKMNNLNNLNNQNVPVSLSNILRHAAVVNGGGGGNGSGGSDSGHSSSDLEVAVKEEREEEEEEEEENSIKKETGETIPSRYSTNPVDHNLESSAPINLANGSAHAVNVMLTPREESNQLKRKPSGPPDEEGFQAKRQVLPSVEPLHQEAA